MCGAELPDISQTGNFEGFRNETFNDRPFLVDSGTYLTKKQGIFKCDFVSYERPPGAVISSQACASVLSKSQTRKHCPISVICQHPNLRPSSRSQTWVPAGYADWMPDQLFDEWFNQLVQRAAEFARGSWVYEEGGGGAEMDLNAVLLGSVEKVDIYSDHANRMGRDKQENQDKDEKKESFADEITKEEQVFDNELPERFDESFWLQAFLGWLREESTLLCPSSDDTFVSCTGGERMLTRLCGCCRCDMCLQSR